MELFLVFIIRLLYNVLLRDRFSMVFRRKESLLVRREEVYYY